MHIKHHPLVFILQPLVVCIRVLLCLGIWIHNYVLFHFVEILPLEVTSKRGTAKFKEGWNVQVVASFE